MRKLIAHLFISLDGVVEAPDRFLREDLYPELDEFADETIGGQDAVLLGRRTYQQWAAFWPGSSIQPFAGFINPVHKHVVSRSLKALEWGPSTLVSGPLFGEIASLKALDGGAIGVHGSPGLVQSLLVAGLLDELRLVVCPAVVGQGRRLLSREGRPLQFDLRSARRSRGGLQYLALEPRA